MPHEAITHPSPIPSSKIIHSVVVVLPKLNFAPTATASMKARPPNLLRMWITKNSRDSGDRQGDSGDRQRDSGDRQGDSGDKAELTKDADGHAKEEKQKEKKEKKEKKADKEKKDKKEKHEKKKKKEQEPTDGEEKEKKEKKQNKE